MPGRFFRGDIDWDALIAAAGIVWPPPGEVRPPEGQYNIAPSQLAPIIRNIPEGDAPSSMTGLLELAPAIWGLIPSWWNKPISEKKFASHNARSETLEESNVFRGAFRHRRCLVPASGFFVWTGETGNKTPYAIGMKDADHFCIAGLWDRAMIDGSEIDTFSIVTTLPNDLLAAFDARSPVIVRPEDYGLWLDSARKPGPDFFNPPPSDDMRWWPVGPAVGNVRNQGPELIEEV